MTDFFAPPTPSPTTRTKPPLCGVREGDDRCTLYTGHHGGHRDQHSNRTWGDEES